MKISQLKPGDRFTLDNSAYPPGTEFLYCGTDRSPSEYNHVAWLEGRVHLHKNAEVTPKAPALHAAQEAAEKERDALRAERDRLTQERDTWEAWAARVAGNGRSWDATREWLAGRVRSATAAEGALRGWRNWSYQLIGAEAGNAADIPRQTIITRMMAEATAWDDWAAGFLGSRATGKDARNQLAQRLNTDATRAQWAVKDRDEWRNRHAEVLSRLGLWQQWAQRLCGRSIESDVDLRAAVQRHREKFSVERQRDEWKRKYTELLETRASSDQVTSAPKGRQWDIITGWRVLALDLLGLKTHTFRDDEVDAQLQTQLRDKVVHAEAHEWVRWAEELTHFPGLATTDLREVITQVFTRGREVVHWMQALARDLAGDQGVVPFDANRETVERHISRLVSEITSWNNWAKRALGQAPLGSHSPETQRVFLQDRVNAAAAWQVFAKLQDKRLEEWELWAEKLIGPQCPAGAAAMRRRIGQQYLDSNQLAAAAMGHESVTRCWRQRALALTGAAIPIDDGELWEQLTRLVQDGQQHQQWCRWASQLLGHAEHCTCTPDGLRMRIAARVQHPIFPETTTRNAWIRGVARDLGLPPVEKTDTLWATVADTVRGLRTTELEKAAQWREVARRVVPDLSVDALHADVIRIVSMGLFEQAQALSFWRQWADTTGVYSPTAKMTDAARRIHLARQLR